MIILQLIHELLMLFITSIFLFKKIIINKKIYLYIINCWLGYF